MLKRIYIDNYKCLVNFEIHKDDKIAIFIPKRNIVFLTIIL